MPFPTRPRCAFFAGLFLLAGPAAAQTPPPTAALPPAPMAQPAPVAVPAVDPQVTALFQQTIAAHKALIALSATVTVLSTGAGPKVNQTVTLAFQKPNQAKISVSNSAGPLVQLYAGSKTITLYIIKDKSYQVRPVPPGTDTVPLILSQAHSILLLLAGHPEALNSLLAQPGVAASLSPSSTYTLAPVDTAVVTLPAAGGGRATLTFDIGKTDHLLRRITESSSIPGPDQTQKVMVTETVTALSATPTLTAADFAFTPPAGVTRVAAPKAGQNPPMHDPRLVPGAKPFPVAAKDLNGRPLTLAQYRGKVVLMDFWATWCGPCVGEVPNVIAAYKKYHAQGFDIVGVSLDQSRTPLVHFIAENKMPWRQVYDGKYWSSAVPREYGVMAIPFGLLVGRDGKIAAVDVRGPALEAAIQQALAK